MDMNALWIVTVADGKGGSIVVYTTDLCTFVLCFQIQGENG